MKPTPPERLAAQIETDVLRQLRGASIADQVATLRELVRLLDKRADSWEHIHEMHEGES